MTEQETSNQKYNFSPEQRLFVDKAKAAAKQALIRGVLAHPDSASHPNRLKAMGLLWTLTRQAARVTVKETANRMNITWQDLMLFEGGTLDPHDIREGFIIDLSQTLESPEILEAHTTLFGLPDETKKD